MPFVPGSSSARERTLGKTPRCVRISSAEQTISMSNISQTQRKYLVPRVALSELVYSKEKDEFNIPKNLTKQKMSNQSAKKGGPFA